MGTYSNLVEEQPVPTSTAPRGGYSQLLGERENVREPAPMWQTPVTGRGRVQDPNLPEFSGDYLPGFQGLGYELGAAINPSDRGLTEFTINQLKDQGAEFKADDYGNPMVMFPEGSGGLFKDAPKGQWFHLNKPGVSPRDVTTGAVTAGAFIPAAKGAQAVMGAGGSALRGAGVGAGLAGATQGALDLGAALTGNTENIGSTVPGISIPNMLWAGVAEFLPDLLMGKFTQNVPPPGVPQHLENISQQNRQAAQAAGVDLTRGQTAGFPGALEMTRTLSAMPETSFAMTERFLRQNDQAQRATQDVVAALGSGAPQLPPGQLGSDYMQTGAKSAIDAANEARRQAGRPLYRTAVHENPNMVDTGPLMSQLHDVSGGYAPGTPMRNTLNRIGRWLGGDEISDVSPDGQLFRRPSEELTLEQAHNTQKELRGMAREAERSGDGDRARVLRNTRRQVLGYIEDVSPVYRQARSVWRDLSGPVEELEQGFIGRVANLDQANLESLYGRIFNPIGGQPRRVRDTFRQVVNRSQPGTYEAMRQDYMEMLLSKQRDTGTGEVPNIPNHINRTLFPTRAHREMWAEGNPEHLEAIENLSRALDQAAKGRHVGSPTATRLELIKQALSSKIPPSLGHVIYRTLGGMTDVGLGTLATKRNQAIRDQAVGRELMPQDNMVEDILRQYQNRPPTTNPMISELLQGARVPMTEDVTGNPSDPFNLMRQLGVQ